MLAIRMQRTGRKGSAQFRMIVQDSRRTPTSGNIVALLGHYDPHSKVTTIDKEKVSLYLSNGAQPSDRVIRILQQEKIKLPTWVTMPPKKTSAIKHKDKLRKNHPAEEKQPEQEAITPETTASEADVTPSPKEVTEEAQAVEVEAVDTPEKDGSANTEQAEDVEKDEPTETESTEAASK